jgi:hypothetical protein
MHRIIVFVDCWVIGRMCALAGIPVPASVAPRYASNGWAKRPERGKTDTAEPDIHFPAIPGAGPIHGMTPQYRSLSVSPMPTASSNDAGLIGFPQRSLCSRRARSPLSSRQRAACKRAGYTRNLRQSGRVAGAQPNPPQRDPTCWGIATHRLVDPDTAPVGRTDCRLSRSTCLAVWALRRNYLNTHTIHP